MTRSSKYYEWWQFGPEINKPSTTCIYTGTSFCRDWCSDWDTVSTNCTLARCPRCRNHAYCLCAAGHLPRPIILKATLTLPPPNGHTLFIPTIQAQASRYLPDSHWLLLNPRWSAEQALTHYLAHYHTHAPYYLYAANLGILIAGPIATDCLTLVPEIEEVAITS